jgi:PDZ domain-containing protein
VRRRLLVLVPSIALALSLWAVPLPLFSEGPGPARDVVPLIDISGTSTYQPEGRLLFTTVDLGRINLFDAVAAAIDPNRNVVPESEVIPPGLTDEQYDRISLSLMDSSKIAAVVSALSRLTDYPRDHGAGVIVYETAAGSPAHRRLFPGDLITAVDGEPLQGLAELRAVIEEAGVGSTLRISVEPVEGSGRSRTIPIRVARERGGDRPVIGIVAVPNFPFEVSIQSGNIGGPSAGLMWALGIADLLTPGDLGGGRTLAGTGDIDLEGRVRPIGGVGLKVLAAERAGADVFLLPPSNLAEARGTADGIDLVPVSTLQEALDYLERS